MLRGLSIFRGSLRVVWRFPLRSSLTILSAVLGVAGALCSVNYALGGRQKVIDQLARLGTNVLIVTPQQSRSVAGRVRTGGIVTTLTQADYAAMHREIPLFVRGSAISTRTFLVKAGDLAKNNCTVIGTEPDYMALKDGSPNQGISLMAPISGARLVWPYWAAAWRETSSAMRRPSESGS